MIVSGQACMGSTSTLGQNKNCWDLVNCGSSYTYVIYVFYARMNSICYSSLMGPLKTFLTEQSAMSSLSYNAWIIFFQGSVCVSVSLLS